MRSPFHRSVEERRVALVLQLGDDADSQLLGRPR